MSSSKGIRLFMYLIYVTCYLISKTFVSSMSINVYDNVLSKLSCDVLHREASKAGLGHKSFTRPMVNKDSHPIIEQALDDILSELGDDINEKEVQYVEYWTRQEWRHIEAHADIDEHLAKEQDLDYSHDQSFRYPQNGHVLYLKIGSKVRGPTCVFPGRSQGGDLLKHSSKFMNHDPNNVELVVVPAKEGRLLRFPGEDLHAVPRPADLWFLPFVQGAAQFEPEEEWGRSVILFNTWTNAPPKDVPLDAMASPVSNNASFSINPFCDWINAFNPKKVEICSSIYDQEDSSENISAKIWLLGNERRRGYSMRTVKLSTSSDVKDAMLESQKVNQMTMQIPQ
jgi:hypothetical protein